MPTPTRRRKLVSNEFEVALAMDDAGSPPRLPDEEDPARQPVDPPQQPVPPPDDEPPDEEDGEDDEDDEDPAVATPPAQSPPTGPPAHPRVTRYEARIQILDAFQYPGAMRDAPDWVDRNWIGYADADELRSIPAGPCLRVPLPSGLTAICRVGDFVCRQSVVLSPTLPPDVRVEVWEQEQFFKLFIPRDVPVSAPDYVRPFTSSQDLTPAPPDAASL